jgi:hypothetical protein
MRLDVRFVDDQVQLPDTHLSRMAVVHDTLAASAIRDVDPNATPPEIRTRSGGTLFVSATQRAELESFCRDNQIPVRQRPDVWADLLEPFLDTEFTAADQAATLGRLSQIGLVADEVGAIRARVGRLMLAYNGIHGDWYHLGLADLLEAASDAHSAELGDIQEFQAWAMRVAELSPGPAAARRSHRTALPGS